MSLGSSLRLLLLGMIWGASFLFQRITVPAVGAAFTAASRLALAAILLLLLVRLLGRSLQLRSKWRAWLLLGSMSSAVPFLSFAFAARYLPAGYLAVINATVPLMTVLLIWALTRSRPSFSKLVGVVVGLLGVAVLARYGNVPMNASALIGVGLALLASLMYAASALYIRRYHADSDPLALAAASQLAAAAVTFPLAVANFPSSVPTLEVLLSLITLGLVCTGLAYALYFRLLSDIGSEKAVTNTFLVPLFAQLWGALFLGERLTLVGALGFGLVLLAIALVLEVLRWPFGRRSARHRDVP